MKNWKTIGTIIALLAVLGTISWIILKTSDFFLEEIITEEKYSFTGTVLEINSYDNFLIIRETGEDGSLKVIIGQNTKLFKVLYQPDLEDGVFATERKEIGIKEIRRGDSVFVKTGTNIFEKKIIGDVEYIEVL